MRDTDRHERLAALAEKIHEHDTDLQGVAYIEHLRRVASAVSNDAKPIAWLHDAIEDHPYCLPEIEHKLTIVELTAVLLLRRRPGDTYDEYVERVATWPGRIGELAREVKCADLRDNIGRLTPELERLRARYTAAIERLDCGCD